MTRDHLTASQRTGGEPILTADHGWGYGVAVATARTAEGVPPAPTAGTAAMEPAGSSTPRRKPPRS